jgi:predicted membrane channel-forming protein YqfA (hemolysin III family)
MGLKVARDAEIVYPEQPSAEDRILIPMPEFSEIKQWIEEMTNPVLHASSFATTFLGVAIGSFVAWLQMKHGTTSSNTVLVITIFSALLALFMTWVEYTIRKSHGSDRDRLCRVMERWERTCPRFTPEGEIQNPGEERSA